MMKIFLIVYAINYAVLIVEAFGLIKFADKLDVDIDDAINALAEHAPFGTYHYLRQWYLTILDVLILSPLFEHFMHALMACEIYNLHRQKESA